MLGCCVADIKGTGQLDLEVSVIVLWWFCSTIVYSIGSGGTTKSGISVIEQSFNYAIDVYYW